MKIYPRLMDSIVQDLKSGDIHSLTSTEDLMTRYSSWGKELKEDLNEALVRFLFRQALLMRGREVGTSLVVVTDDKKVRWQMDVPGLDEIGLNMALVGLTTAFPVRMRKRKAVKKLRAGETLKIDYSVYLAPLGEYKKSDGSALALNTTLVGRFDISFPQAAR